MQTPAYHGYIDNYTPNILVIDDETRIREACRTVLEERGYAVTLAEDGAQGLACIEAQHYDIILLDLVMPGLSGFDVLTRIKKKHPDTVIVVITGYATLEHSVDAMKKGAFDFIPKPFTPDHLRIIAAKALDYTRALRDIAEAGSRLRTMVNSLHEGVMCVNQQLQAVLANPAFLRLVGHDAASVVGRQVRTFVNIPRIEEMIREVLQMDDASLTELTDTFELPSKGASENKIVNVRCFPFIDRRGKTIGAITVLNDITALAKMDRMKSEFVSMVSHEIRGPMNSVMMQLNVVLDGLAGEVSPKQEEILGRASQKIQSLVDMASELLDLARIESGLISQEREPVDMAGLVAEQIDLHRPGARSAGLELFAAINSGLPKIFAHRRNMEEVVSNLITNAIKYTPAGGRIDAALMLRDDYLCLTVKDSGLGLEPDDLGKIFQRFYRVKNEKTRYIPGTGLGLALVKSIVDFHQGYIDVQSKPGQGSVFSVFLPVER